MAKFTRHDVVAKAFEIYGKPVCVDMLDDAMLEPTLEDAVDVIILDSQYWDSEGIFSIMKGD